MALFLIRRNVQGASQDDLDAASYRAIACSFYYAEMRWQRSFWDQEAGVLFCLYEARTVEDVLAHAERARIPCDEVLNVSGFGPEDYIGEPAGAEAAPTA